VIGGSFAWSVRWARWAAGTSRPAVQPSGRLAAAAILLLGLVGAPTLAAQVPDSAAPLLQDITNPGVVRASATVDSVFLDGLADDRLVSPGDFASYLMARLGVAPIPESLRFRVVPDTSALTLTGRVSDLPPEAVAELGPLVSFLDPSTVLEARVTLTPETSRAVRFRLAEAFIGGVRVPEDILRLAMADVGRRYPALTHTGRDLFVAIPAGARITLESRGVRLTAPPRRPAPPGQAP
jgi:hypothetical protein